MDNRPLFTLNIRDESEDLTVYSGHTSSLPWVLLSQFETNYFVYDWVKFIWKSVSREQYTDFRLKYYYLELTTGMSENYWLELPISTGRPAKLVDNSEVTKHKKYRPRVSINSHFSSSQSETGLEKFIQTERILDSLARDNY